MAEIKFIKTTSPKAKPSDETQLGFGRSFTDHMFLMDYTQGKGWHDPRIVPYGPLSLDPSCSVFHYGQEVFEGMNYTNEEIADMFGKTFEESVNFGKGAQDMVLVKDIL